MFTKTTLILGLVTVGLISQTLCQQDYDFRAQNKFLQYETDATAVRRTDAEKKPVKIVADDQIPEIKSLSTWMTDIKQHPKIAGLKANQLSIPGAHHAGLTYLEPYFELVEAIFGNWGLGDLFKTFNTDSISRIIQTLSVPQKHSVKDILEMGARYLDLRVSADRDHPEIVYLSHCFLSTIRLNDSLHDVNNFLLANPGEIIILDIVVDWDPAGTVGNPVPHPQLEAMVRQYIDPKFLLGRANATQAISTYGGVFITGFAGNNNLDQVKIKAGWGITQAVQPLQIVTNIKDYYESGAYLKQEPIDYDFLKCDPYTTPDVVSNVETVLYDVLNYNKPQSLDPIVNSRIIPANLVASAKLSNSVFYNTVDRSEKLTQIVNIIEMDDFSAQSAIRAIEINFNRYF